MCAGNVLFGVVEGVLLHSVLVTCCLVWWRVFYCTLCVSNMLFGVVEGVLLHSVC